MTQRPRIQNNSGVPVGIDDVACSWGLMTQRSRIQSNSGVPVGIDDEACSWGLMMQRPRLQSDSRGVPVGIGDAEVPNSTLETRRARGEFKAELMHS